MASNLVDKTEVEVIREDLRQVVSEERKSHREAALKKNRSALGEIQDKKRSWDSKNVVEKAMLLKKKALPMEDYLRLQSSLIQDEENISSFLGVGNILRALVRDLSGVNPAIQFVAANCCCNIALANSKACLAVAKTAGPYLVAQLDSLNYPLVEVCAWTIGNLAGGSEHAFNALHAQGCLKKLSSLLRNCEPLIIPSVIYAIKHCLSRDHEIPDSEMMDLTKILIQRSWSTEFDVLWLLALLSSREVCRELILPILPEIFNNLSTTLDAEEPNFQSVSASIRLLGNSVSDPSGSAAEAILHHADEKLIIILEKLLCHSRSHVRKETLWLIGNLYCHSVPRITERSRNLLNSLPSLQRAIRSSRDYNFL